MTQKLIGIPGRVYQTRGNSYTADTNGVITVPSNVGGYDIVDLLDEGAIMSAPPPANFRNLIDGGDFTVNPFQRGTSFTGITNTATYTADRFFAVGGASSSISVSKQANTTVPGFSQALQFGRANSNTNTAAIYLGQVLETADSVRCQGQTVTFSFWASSGANFSGANLSVQVVSGTGSDQSAANLVAGSWTGASNVINTTQGINSAMTRYTFTGVVPVGCTQLGVLVGYTPTGTAGSNDWVQFEGFQLEIDLQASPFEHRDAQVELEICQRYFYQINEPASSVIVGTGSNIAANTQLFYLALPVQMRTAPTVTVTAGTFKVNSSTGGVAAATGLTGNATHTVNAIGLTSTGTGTAGQAAMLQGGGGSGLISATADY